MPILIGSLNITWFMKVRVSWKKNNVNMSLNTINDGPNLYL